MLVAAATTERKDTRGVKRQSELPSNWKSIAEMTIPPHKRFISNRLIPVYVTTNIQYISGTTGRANALAHKDALHFATAALGGGGSKGTSVTGKHGVRVQSNYIPEYLSTVTTADILYGVIENRDTSGVYIKSST